MLFACWSVKGGSGTTVVAASLAVLFARSSPEGVLLLDAAGDLPVVFGLDDRADHPGLADWLTADDPTPSSLARLEVDVAPKDLPGLRLVPWRGSPAPPLDGLDLDALIATMADEARPVVVDCGSTGGPLTLALAAAAGLSLLVLRPCYLGLHRALAAPIRPSGVVFVEEPQRCLKAHDVEDALGVPVRARIPWSEGVARAVDAGLLASSLPRALARSLAVAA